MLKLMMIVLMLMLMLTMMLRMMMINVGFQVGRLGVWGKRSWGEARHCIVPRPTYINTFVAFIHQNFNTTGPIYIKSYGFMAISKI